MHKRTLPPYNSWITIPRPNPLARVRLLCIPYAGGGPSAYAPWNRHIPDWIELRVVAPPGREIRAEEASVRTMEDFVAPIVTAVLSDRSVPFAIFGHSMGAVVGYEVALRCRDAGFGPNHLFLSGRAFPADLPAKSPLYRLPDAEFLQTIRDTYGGLPEELDEYPEILQQAQDLLRIDLEVLERFQPRFESKLDIPLTLLWSDRDSSISATSMMQWKEVTRGETSHKILGGDHFYLLDQPFEIATLVATQLLQHQGC